ncbi:MAG: 3-deoxy-8-phosphooctulonate synthase [Minisyncoccota bacterium]
MIALIGPCQCESFEHSLMMAGKIAAVSERLGLPIVFKMSFDKANRTSGGSPRGAGMDVTLRSFRAIKTEYGLKTITDIHEPWQAAKVASVVDIIQIPALLCRQTDLIEAAASTGRSVNIKKGQFLSPGDMIFAVHKAQDAGADDVLVTERGTTFGYGDLVVDMRSMPIMGASGPDAVIYDATHSLQSPGSLVGSTGGQRAFMVPLAQAAIAAGADGLFVETHQDPGNAPSDGAVMLQVDLLYDFLARMRDLHAFVKGL